MSEDNVCLVAGFLEPEKIADMAGRHEYFTLFEAISKNGTVSNYINQEIQKSQAGARSIAFGELKFFAGILISVSVLSLVLKAPSDAQPMQPEQFENSLIIISLYFLAVIILALRTKIILSLDMKNVDEQIKFFAFWDASSNATLYYPKIMSDYQWACLIMPILHQARANERKEARFRRWFVLTAILYLFIMLLIIAYFLPWSEIF